MAVMFGIRKHTPYFGVRTKIVSFMVSSVSVPERVGADINRAKFVACAWNIAYQDICLFDLFYPYIRFTRQANAYLPVIVGTIPEVLFIADDGLLRKSVKEKAVAFFLHAKHYRSAVSVGKSRIAFPETAGKSPASRFELDFRGLPLAHQYLDSVMYVCCMFCHNDCMFLGAQQFPAAYVE